MKRSIFTLCLLFTGLLAVAQKKKDNTIIIRTQDAPEVAYKKIAAILEDKGYAIETTNKERLSLTTAPKSVKIAAIKINCYIREGQQTQIVLNGMDGLANSPNGYTRTFNGGMKGSPGRLSWDELDSVAKLYREGQIEYTKVD